MSEEDLEQFVNELIDGDKDHEQRDDIQLS